jgi:hypothetical protein
MLAQRVEKRRARVEVQRPRLSVHVDRGLQADIP